MPPAYPISTSSCASCAIDFGHRVAFLKHRSAGCPAAERAYVPATLSQPAVAGPPRMCGCFGCGRFVLAESSPGCDMKYPSCGQCEARGVAPQAYDIAKIAVPTNDLAVPPELPSTSQAVPSKASEAQRKHTPNENYNLYEDPSPTTTDASNPSCKVTSTEVSGKASATPTSHPLVSPLSLWSKSVNVNPITLPTAEVSSMRVTIQSSNGKRKNPATTSADRPRRKHKAVHYSEDDSLPLGYEHASTPANTSLAPHRKSRCGGYAGSITRLLKNVKTPAKTNAGRLPIPVLRGLGTLQSPEELRRISPLSTTKIHLTQAVSVRQSAEGSLPQPASPSRIGSLSRIGSSPRTEYSPQLAPSPQLVSSSALLDTRRTAAANDSHSGSKDTTHLPSPDDTEEEFLLKLETRAGMNCTETFEARDDGLRSPKKQCDSEIWTGITKEGKRGSIGNPIELTSSSESESDDETDGLDKSVQPCYSESDQPEPCRDNVTLDQHYRFSTKKALEDVLKGGSIDFTKIKILFEEIKNQYNLDQQYKAFVKVLPAPRRATAHAAFKLWVILHRHLATMQDTIHYYGRDGEEWKRYKRTLEAIPGKEKWRLALRGRRQLWVVALESKEKGEWLEGAQFARALADYFTALVREGIGENLVERFLEYNKSLMVWFGCGTVSSSD